MLQRIAGDLFCLDLWYVNSLTHFISFGWSKVVSFANWALGFLHKVDRQVEYTTEKDEY
jgi:hypothetical protein